MRGKKELLADILFNSNLVQLFKRLPMRNKLIILNYHRLRSTGPGFRTDFDDNVYGVDADVFERQMKWLKNNTRILSEQDLLDQNRNGEFVAPRTSLPCVVITFDDGYLDNYTVAYPILKHYGMPAILFVATQMIHNRQVPWWDVIAYLLKRCEQPSIVYDGRPFPLGEQRGRTIAFFQTMMKQEKYERTKYLLTELSEACGVALPAPELQDRELLTWTELREMAENGIAIGSHTHTHRVLSTLGPGDQKEEMILSKLMIEANIHRPVWSISYPVGELHYITPETPLIASLTGYRLGFTTNSGINDWKSIEPYGVKRTARLLEKVSTVSLLTVLPGLFSWDSAAARQSQLAEAHPTYADTHYRLGVIHLGQGRIEEAIGSFQRAVDANPEYTEARIKLGISQAFAGRLDEAERHLSSILVKRPSFADVHYYLGIVHASGHRVPEAIADLQRAIAINPSYKDALLKLGVLCCEQGRYGAALQMLERASRLEPPDQDLLALVDAGQGIIGEHGSECPDLARLLSPYIGGRSHIDELVRGFVTHLSVSPNLNDIMLIVEKGAFPVENLENLLLLFNDYRAMFPGYSDIRYTLGVIHRMLERPVEAEKSFLESLELNPGYIKARMGLFKLLNEQGRFGEALEQGRVLEGFRLPYPDLFCGLAEALHGLGRSKEAEGYAVQAVTLNPAYRHGHEVLGRIRASAGGTGC